MSGLTTVSQRESLAAEFSRRLPTRAISDPQWVPEVVDTVLQAARENHASDVHLVPDAAGLRMAWRLDGVLQEVARFPLEAAPRIIARLKVMAQLLTYRTDVPQEGAIRDGAPEDEVRVSTFPTLFGEKGVIRLFAGARRLTQLADLGFAPSTLEVLRGLLQETGGALLVTGPAGSGKTTTVYACLRELVACYRGCRSLTSIEDPIETVVEGVAQSQVHPASGFDLGTALRSLVRQDPEVILVGEIRDRLVAETVFQAALTGHLILTTFHAGSAAEGVSRLVDMGIEPYQLRSGLLGIVSQRLVRKLCDCSQIGSSSEERLGLPIEQWRVPVGCEECHGTGYRDRLLLSELLVPENSELRRAILAREDSDEIERLAVAGGMQTLWQARCEAIQSGRTTPAEVRRVLGFRGFHP